MSWGEDSGGGDETDRGRHRGVSDEKSEMDERDVRFFDRFGGARCSERFFQFLRRSEKRWKFAVLYDRSSFV